MARRTLGPLVAGLLVCSSGATFAAGPAVSEDERRPGPPDVYGSALPTAPFLPVDGADLPLTSSDGGSDRLTLTAPSVQAIPTPTAFEAGSVVLAAVVATRAARRLANPPR